MNDELEKDLRDLVGKWMRFSEGDCYDNWLDGIKEGHKECAEELRAVLEKAGVSLL